MCSICTINSAFLRIRVDSDITMQILSNTKPTKLSGTPEELAVPVPVLAPFVLLPVPVLSPVVLLNGKRYARTSSDKEIIFDTNIREIMQIVIKTIK